MTARTDPKLLPKCKMVELHYFGGMNYDETAKVLGISAATSEKNSTLGHDPAR